MIVTDTVYVKWNAKTKRHYTDKGYAFTKMGDSFLVNVCDLTNGSNVDVEIKCDYCGRTYKVKWYSYIAMKNREKIHKDACKYCCEIKSKESIEKEYGGYSELQKTISSKRESTNIKRYGCKNVFSNDSIKDKIISTNLRKYGVKYTQQNKDVRGRTEKTCMQKYGVSNYVELFKGMYIGENSPVWKGGAKSSRNERATHEYIDWRKSIFNRDKYTCKCCGDRNGNGHFVELHAHHIYNWNDNVDKRYDICNGITLCSKCHYLFHSIYGKHNNTEEQLYEFLSNMLDKKVC